MAILFKNKGQKTRKPQQKLTTLIDVLTPSALAFEAKRIVMGAQYQVAMVITHYPSSAGVGWLSNVVTMEGVTASIHVEPKDAFDLLESIKISMGVYKSKEINGSDFEKEQARKKYKSAEQMLKKIDDEQQRVVDVTVVLLITAPDEDTLKKRVKRVESRLGGMGMRGRIPTFSQQEGLLSAGPWGTLAQEIRDLGARNMTTETLAASFPFVYSGLNDGDGVLLGRDKGGGIVLIDFWLRQGDRTNSNILVMGRPGVGKSATVKKIILDEYKKGTKIIIIDPEREYKELCHNLNGNWVDCGGGLKGRINPLQAREVPMDDEDENDDSRLYPEEIVQRGPLALHFQTMRTFFRMYLKDVSKIQMAMLEIALEKVYQEFGIGWDTKPEELNASQWPTVKDLYDWIEKQDMTKEPEWRELALRIRSAAVGADAALWAGETTIQADRDIVVLDIHRLLEGDEEIRRAQFFNILSWSWGEVSKDRSQKVLLVVDEAYLLADPETPQALAFLRNTSKRIRKYEGGLATITHNLVDFLDPAVRRYGQALVDNPVYKIIMGQGDKDIEALTKLMTLSEKEVQTLEKGERGSALFIAGNRRLQMNIELFDYEKELIGQAGGR